MIPLRSTACGTARLLRAPALLRVLCAMAALLVGGTLRAADAAAGFEQANTLYYQGKFPEAVAAYDAFMASNSPTANVWFNLGNAAYKAGRLGRSIAAFRMAERLSPRDPAIRANLEFVRGKAYSDERVRVPVWKSLVRLGTLNEWTLLAALAFWGAGAALALRVLTGRPWSRALFACGLLTVLFSAGLAAAWHEQRSGEAIVTAREVTVRFGPLEEAQAAFQLRDGAEVTVLDTKGDWLQVRDPESRVGWMRRADARVLPGLAPR